jgi:protein-tyrosine-phosphatase
MIKIMFVCHGNICRSPMAEFLLKDIVKKYKGSFDFKISDDNEIFKKAEAKIKQIKVNIKNPAVCAGFFQASINLVK